MYEEFVLNWLFAFTYRPLLPLHLASSKSNDQKDKLACLKVLTTSAWYVYTIFINERLMLDEIVFKNVIFFVLFSGIHHLAIEE